MTSNPRSIKGPFGSWLEVAKPSFSRRHSFGEQNDRQTFGEKTGRKSTRERLDSCGMPQVQCGFGANQTRAEVGHGELWRGKGMNQTRYKCTHAPAVQQLSSRQRHCVTACALANAKSRTGSDGAQLGPYVLDFASLQHTCSNLGTRQL
jgi:hypothetical protein